MHIHQEIEPSIDEVINKFSLKLLKHLLPTAFFSCERYHTDMGTVSNNNNLT